MFIACCCSYRDTSYTRRYRSSWCQHHRFRGKCRNSSGVSCFGDIRRACHKIIGSATDQKLASNHYKVMLLTEGPTIYKIRYLSKTFEKFDNLLIIRLDAHFHYWTKCDNVAWLRTLSHPTLTVDFILFASNAALLCNSSRRRNDCMTAVLWRFFIVVCYRIDIDDSAATLSLNFYPTLLLKTHSSARIEEQPRLHIRFNWLQAVACNVSSLKDRCITCLLAGSSHESELQRNCPFELENQNYF